MPDLEQTLATMPLQTSLSFWVQLQWTKFRVAPYFAIHRYVLLGSYAVDYHRNVIQLFAPNRVCLLLYQLKIRMGKPLRLHTCPGKCPFAYFLIVFDTVILLKHSSSLNTCIIFTSSEFGRIGVHSSRLLHAGVL